MPDVMSTLLSAADRWRGESNPIGRWWTWALLAFGTLFHIPWSIPYTSGSQPPMSRDSALFEYIGWLITQGGIPYYTALDIKTPLSYYFSSGLWVVAGGNPLWQHRLAVFVMVAAQIGLSLAIAYLVYDTTNSAVGAAVSGLAIYTLPAMYIGGARGLRPKTLMALAGVVALLAL